MSDVFSPSQNICLRLAKKADEALLMGWRNLPEIIALGSSQRAVDPVEHAKWFARTLISEKKRLFVVLWNDMPIGQIRFEIQKFNQAEVSIFLINKFTGKSLGVTTIIEGCKLAFDAFPVVDCIVAFVRDNNLYSLRAFFKAGFETDSTGAQRTEHIRLKLLRS
jgi:RimJ/RimL family protein N-acetyltransferase